jgi:hypothetical protein
MQDPGYGLPRIHLPRTPVNRGKKKVRSVVAPILPPPARCAPFLERRSSTSRRTLQGGLSQSVFTYLLGGYLPVDSPHHFMVALSGLIVYSRVHIRGCCGTGVAAVTDA